MIIVIILLYNAPIWVTLHCWLQWVQRVHFWVTCLLHINATEEEGHCDQNWVQMRQKDPVRSARHDSTSLLIYFWYLIFMYVFLCSKQLFKEVWQILDGNFWLKRSECWYPVVHGESKRIADTVVTGQWPVSLKFRPYTLQKPCLLMPLIFIKIFWTQ